MYTSYVQNVLIVQNIQTPFNTQIDTKDINQGTKNMVNVKVVDVTLLKSELVNQTMPHTHHRIMNIVDKTIKESLPNDWIMNWIKPMSKRGDKN